MAYKASARRPILGGVTAAGIAWTDTRGHFWLFGGYGVSQVAGTSAQGNQLNDLWEFTP
jgi:hypothetical protein